MPTITIQPGDGPYETATTVDGGWASAWAWTGGHDILIPAGLALLAVIAGALTTYLVMRRPTRADLPKRLMYVPLFLVNGAAVYGQVAFFYENVAPHAWAMPGKLALATIIAAAIESISVYVGWHAHDALLNKAGNTASRLRRASYVIAAFVASINYAHFANRTPDNFLGLTAAAAAFGLLSLLSPWLWGLHTRRMQHVQLRKEGVVDASGATFSGERIRSFPLRAYLARRWSIDHYVTDPRDAWEGYNAELRSLWAVNVDQPGWWLRLNPVARVRQLTEAHDQARTNLHQVEATVADLTVQLTDLVAEATTLRMTLTSTEGSLADTREQLAEVTTDRDNRLRENRELTAEVSSLKASATELEARLAASETARVEDARGLRQQYAEDLRKARAEATVPNLADRRGKTGGARTPASAKTPVRARITDEEAVQRLMEVPSDAARNLPSGDLREWSQQAIVDELKVGWGRAPRLQGAVMEEQRRRASESSSGDQAVNQ